MSVQLIEFGAPWCPPCRAMSPILKELIAEGHDIRIVNTDQEPALANKYRIGALPTLVFLKDNQEVKRIVGARSKDILLSEFRDLS